MPQYKKVFDIGTYTGNGGLYRVGVPTFRIPGPTGTQVANSLRFRSGNANFLNRTFSSGNRKTWTWSGWFKRGVLGVYPASGYGQTFLGLNDSDKIWFNDDKFVVYLGTGGTYGFSTYATYRDTSTWYHFMVVVDTTQATSTNRVKMYVNGVEPYINVIAGWPTQNYESNFNSAINHNIGKADNSNLLYLDGHLAENYFIDGTALTPSSFGEYNADRIWVPKAYSGSYGTNGFYLKFASGAVGTDSSGNGNTWTLNGFNVSTANTTYDLMSDSPTDYLSGSMSTANNAACYPTFSSAVEPTWGGGTMSNGNLDISQGANQRRYVDMPIPTTGKWYFEFKVNTLGATNTGFGIFPTSSCWMFGLPASGAYRILSGASDISISGPGTPAAGDTFKIAYDSDNGKVWFGVNSYWFSNAGNTTSDPNTGSNPSFSGLTVTADNWNNQIAVIQTGGGAQQCTGSINFGQRPFTYTIPTGFKALNSYNWPRPSSDSSLWFYGDIPDLVWIKNRSSTSYHMITDTVRGMGLNLITSSTAAETSYPGLSDMNKFGMTIINDSTAKPSVFNENSVYWAWKAGGTAVTNTDGSVTGQVSANRQAGFSIVTFNSGTSADRTVGHGLGAAPNFIIMKSRTSASYNWSIYHSSVASTVKKYMVFTTEGLSDNGSNIWGSAFPTSSVFGFTSGNGVVASTDCIAYCWTAIPGYSAFGSYTGNGSADGPFVYTGFRPRWILWKRTDSTGSWGLVDTTRNTYNVMGNQFYPDQTAAEGSGNAYFDALSNGFKVRADGTYGGTNASSSTQIYAAFAEIPFKYARAR